MTLFSTLKKFFGNEVEEHEIQTQPQTVIAPAPTKTKKPKEKVIVTEANSKCPYCGSMFAKPPRKKTQCTNCKKFVSVRKRPFETEPQLLTKDEVEIVEREWDVYQELKGVFYGYNISNEAFTQRRNELKASLGETMFSLLKDIEKTITELSDKKMLYHSMAVALEAEGNENFIQYLKESYRCELLYLKENSVKKVRISGAMDFPVCRKMNDKVFTINAALEQMPLPNPRCKNYRNSDTGFCMCIYSPE